jgi:ABC-2 type transport system ATP-binding protein
VGLTVNNVFKRFGQKTAVENLSFTFDKPGVFGLLGTNGAGKTTTIRMILGILEKDGGSIDWDGKPVAREWVSFGYLPEERGIYPKVKVAEQLRYFANLRGMHGKDAYKAIDYWAKKLDVSEYMDMTAEQLSKGNQQKIQFITALLHDPELIILDEPFSGLDPVNTDLFKDVIQELVERGKYIVMSSHQMAAVEEYCTDILLLVDGATVLQGNLREIKRSYGRTNLYVGCEEDITPYIDELDITLLRKSAAGYELKIPSEDAAYTLIHKLLDQKLRPDKFEIREPSLHEIFIEKAGERK